MTKSRRTQPAAKAPRPEELTERALRLRLRQQEILAEFGVMALRGTASAELIDRMTVLVAEGMNAEFAKILEYHADEQRLLVRAGVGWNDGVVGHATVGSDLESPAGFALRTGQPVISNHLETDERFRTPELLLEYGIHRAINVILQGDGPPYGVLEVDSRSAGEFTAHDLAFMQGAANLLGMALRRERYERDLQAALDHQQVLLREIDHRIKNSLQLVTSMLNMQAAGADPVVRQHLQDAAGRIAAIARAHQRLHQTGAILNIDLGGYLGDLCRDLDDVAAHCTVDVDVPRGILISIDRAVAVALMVNELITNAAKHAYRDHAPGTIWLRMQRDADGRIAVAVRDEGYGLPDDFDIEQSRGLGLRIFRAFIQQLGAELRIERHNPGTAFILSIPLKSEF